jgi:hypothetical protein
MHHHAWLACTLAALVQALHGSIAGGGYDASGCSAGRRPQHTRDIL